MDEQYMAETLNRILWGCGESKKIYLWNDTVQRFNQKSA